MFYGGSITVPHNTLETSPVVTYFKLAHGIITRVLFYPRHGHASLCHAKVYHRTHQVFPLDPAQDLHSDGEPIVWNEYFELFVRPYELKVSAWNEDDTYDHTFDIWLELTPKADSMPYVFQSAINSLISAIIPKKIR